LNGTSLIQWKPRLMSRLFPGSISARRALISWPPALPSIWRCAGSGLEKLSAPAGSLVREVSLIWWFASSMAAS
jgi:hypothetical protein